ncbi:hypothetical protein ACFOJ6_25475 [Gordonia humi]
MPNADQRRALAHALGLGSELSPFLVSDEEEVVGPLETQVRTILTLADNNSGLLALRRTGHLDDKAIAALQSLG